MNELTSILGIAAALLMGAVNLGPSLVMFARMVASEGGSVVLPPLWAWAPWASSWLRRQASHNAVPCCEHRPQIPHQACPPA